LLNWRPKMIRAFETLRKLKRNKEKVETKWRVAMQVEYELEREIKGTIKAALSVNNVSVYLPVVKVENDTYFMQEGEFKILQFDSPSDEQSKVLKFLNMNIGG